MKPLAKITLISPIFSLNLFLIYPWLLSKNYFFFQGKNYFRRFGKQSCHYHLKVNYSKYFSLV